MRSPVLIALCLVAQVAFAQNTPEILHRFGPGPVRPVQPLTLAADGSLYGLTEGSTADPGSRVYRVTPQGVVESIGAVGDYPFYATGASPLTPDGAGNLWGSTTKGGDLIEIDSSGALHMVEWSFYLDQGGGQVLPGGDGNVYGLGLYQGVVVPYRQAITIPGQGSMRFPALTYKQAQLLIATQAGEMVGSTPAQDGGTDFFHLSTAGAATVFAHGPAEIGAPLCLVEGSDGTLYGVSANGGSAGLGAFFRLAPGHDAETLFEFDATANGTPTGTLAYGSDGKLYGFASGTAQSQGIAFRLAADGTFEALGALPGAPGTGVTGVALMGDSFYGTLTTGGDYGFGAVIRLDAEGGPQVVASMQPYGIYPKGQLPLDAQGNLYGVTSKSGPDSNNGLVFKIAPDGTFTPLSYIPANSGTEPGGVVFGPDGALYGLDSQGGAHGYGTFLRAGLDGSFTVLTSFDSTLGGALDSPLHLGKDGFFYTFANSQQQTGKVLKIGPDGTVQKLFTLMNTYDASTSSGYQGVGTFLDGPDGALYGVTYGGGTDFSGAILRVDAQGGVTVAATFPSFYGPGGQPVIGSDGALYVQGNFTTAGFRWPFTGVPQGVGFAGGGGFLDDVSGLAAGPDGRTYSLAIDLYSAGLKIISYSTPSGSGRLLGSVTDPFSTSYLSGGNIPTITSGDVLYGIANVGGGLLFRLALPPNTPPVVAASRFQVQAGPRKLSVLDGATDAEGDQLTVTSVQGASQGAVTINPDQTLSYTANASFTGVDDFTITVSDGYGGRVNAAVEVYNTAPTAPDLTVFVPRSPGAAKIDLLSGAADVDPGQTVGLASTSAPLHGKITLASGIATYKAAPDFAGEDSFTYTVSDGFGGQATGTVHLQNVALQAAATYYAHLENCDSDISSAVLKVTLSRTGAFTATVNFGATIGFTGVLKPDGTYKGSNGKRYYLELTVDPVTHGLTAYFQVGESSYSGAGGPNTFTVKTPAPQAGRYTFLTFSGKYSLSKNITYTLGDGYGVMTVSAAGAVRLTGHVSDGGAFSLGCQIISDLTCVLRATLQYPIGQGGLTGEFQFGDQPDSDAKGTLHWARYLYPSTTLLVAQDVTITVSRYTPGTPALNGSAPELQYLGGPFATRMTAPLAIASNGLKLTGTSSTATVSVNESTGLFSGTFKDPGTRKTYPVAGAIFQKVNVGVGEFVAPHGYGIAELLPGQ
jgi:hypothetical protein